MKKQEREHLKADPFQEFIEKALEMLKKLKKPILAGVSVIAAIIIITLIITFFRHNSIKNDNKLYADALMVQQSATLTLDQKIQKLEGLEVKSGVSSSIKLTLASLYFEKGDLQKAKETLDKFPGSSYRLIEDKKSLLDAEISLASGKGKEAVDKLSSLAANPDCQLSKDFMLFRLAQMQAKTQQNTQAVNNLKKLKEEYPQSAYRTEAQSLLEKLEK